MTRAANNRKRFLSNSWICFNKVYKHNIFLQITVWKFFGCDKSDDPSKSVAGVELFGKAAENPEDRIEKNNNLATIIMVCVVVVIVLTNIITGIFWLIVYRKTNTSEV